MAGLGGMGSGPLALMYRQLTLTVPVKVILTAFVLANDAAGVLPQLSRRRADGSGQLADDRDRTTAGRSAADLTALLYIMCIIGITSWAVWCVDWRLIVRSHGSWRISLILANDLAEGCSVAMILTV